MADIIEEQGLMDELTSFGIIGEDVGSPGMLVADIAQIPISDELESNSEAEKDIRLQSLDETLGQAPDEIGLATTDKSLSGFAAGSLAAKIAKARSSRMKVVTEEDDSAVEEPAGSDGEGEEMIDIDDYSRYSYQKEVNARLQKIDLPKKMKLSDLLLKLANEKADRDVNKSLSKDIPIGSRYTLRVAQPGDAMSTASQRTGNGKQEKKNSIRKSQVSRLQGTNQGTNQGSVPASISEVEENALLPDLPDLNVYLEKLLRDVYENCTRLTVEFADVLDKHKSNSHKSPTDKPSPKKVMGASSRLYSSNKLRKKTDVVSSDGTEDSKAAQQNTTTPLDESISSEDSMEAKAHRRKIRRHSHFEVEQLPNVHGEWETVGRNAYLNGALETEMRMKENQKKFRSDKATQSNQLREIIRSLILDCTLTVRERQELEDRKRSEDNESTASPRDGKSSKLDLRSERKKSLLWIQNLLTKRILSAFDVMQMKRAIQTYSTENLIEHSYQELPSPRRIQQQQSKDEESASPSNSVSMLTTSASSMNGRCSSSASLHQRSAAVLAVYMMSTPMQIGGHFPHSPSTTSHSISNIKLKHQSTIDIGSAVDVESCAQHSPTASLSSSADRTSTHIPAVPAAVNSPIKRKNKSVDVPAKPTNEDAQQNDISKKESPLTSQPFSIRNSMESVFVGSGNHTEFVDSVQVSKDHKDSVAVAASHTVAASQPNKRSTIVQRSPAHASRQSPSPRATMIKSKQLCHNDDRIDKNNDKSQLLAPPQHGAIVSATAAAVVSDVVRTSVVNVVPSATADCQQQPVPKLPSPKRSIAATDNQGQNTLRKSILKPTESPSTSSAAEANKESKDTSIGLGASASAARKSLYKQSPHQPHLQSAESTVTSVPAAVSASSIASGHQIGSFARKSMLRTTAGQPSALAGPSTAAAATETSTAPPQSKATSTEPSVSSVPATAARKSVIKQPPSSQQFQSGDDSVATSAPTTVSPSAARSPRKSTLRPSLLVKKQQPIEPATVAPNNGKGSGDVVKDSPNKLSRSSFRSAPPNNSKSTKQAVTESPRKYTIRSELNQLSSGKAKKKTSTTGPIIEAATATATATLCLPIATDVVTTVCDTAVKSVSIKLETIEKERSSVKAEQMRVNEVATASVAAAIPSISSTHRKESIAVRFLRLFQTSE